MVSDNPLICGFFPEGASCHELRMTSTPICQRPGRDTKKIGQFWIARRIVGAEPFRDPEQGLAVRPPLAFLKGALERQKRRALHEKQGEGRQTEIRHRDIAAPPLPGVRKSRADRAQTSQKGWQKLHPNGESFLR